jgi:hypothetical protein
MTHYRLYFQDSGGHFLKAEDIEVADDAAACAEAARFDHVHDVEVWQGGRKVQCVQPRLRRAG